MAEDAIRVDLLLQGIGQSMLAAQTQLNTDALAQPPGPEGLRTNVAISETEIDVKMVFEDDGSGVNVRPVAAGATQLAELDPGVLSGIRARLVAVADEEARPPTLNANEVREQVLARDDMTRLQGIFGELQVETTYVGSAQRWIVDVKEPGGAILRSIQISDAAE
jgi:hypothetical protein